MKFTGLVLMLVSLAGFAVAGGAVVPEVSPESGVAAVTLISGALLVIRGRRKK